MSFGFPSECDIVVMKPDGTGRHVVVGSHEINLYPDLSPDGTQIAFTSNRDGLVSAIWVADLAGHTLRRLTKPGIEAFYPQWSISGARILLGDNFERPHTNTFVVNPAGGRARQITFVEDPDSAFFASYSPDGNHIVLISDVDRASGFSLFTANGNGSDMTAIVTDHPRVTYADWGPEEE
jgi:TolB protein